MGLCFGLLRRWRSLELRSEFRVQHSSLHHIATLERPRWCIRSRGLDRLTCRLPSGRCPGSCRLIWTLLGTHCLLQHESAAAYPHHSRLSVLLQIGGEKREESAQRQPVNDRFLGSGETYMVCGTLCFFCDASCFCPERGATGPRSAVCSPRLLALLPRTLQWATHLNHHHHHHDDAKPRDPCSAFLAAFFPETLQHFDKSLSACTPVPVGLLETYGASLSEPVCRKRDFLVLQWMRCRCPGCPYEEFFFLFFNSHCVGIPVAVHGQPRKPRHGMGEDFGVTLIGPVERRSAMSHKLTDSFAPKLLLPLSALRF